MAISRSAEYRGGSREAFSLAARFAVGACRRTWFAHVRGGIAADAAHWPTGASQENSASTERQDEFRLGQVHGRGRTADSCRLVDILDGFDGHKPTRRVRRPEKSVAFRTCDFAAWNLGTFDGFPRIELYWPEERRDAVVANASALLAQYGEQLIWSPGQPAPQRLLRRRVQVSAVGASGDGRRCREGARYFRP